MTLIPASPYPARRVFPLGLAALTALLIAGCRVGPNYTRPAVATPAVYRGALAPEVSKSVVMPIANDDWSTLFTDPVLHELIARALANNLDLRIAAIRIVQAQDRISIARSQQYPTISGGGSYSAIRIPPSLAGDKNDGTPAASFFDGGGPSASATWALDFWGLYRRQTEAARADMLSFVWAQRATRSTLISDMAGAYFRLRSLDAQLRMTDNTIEARRDSVKLTEALVAGGAASTEDLRQAQELLEQAQANRPEIQRQITAVEGAISVLLGIGPEPIPRGNSIDRQPHPATVPVGIPSDLLVRRPDIQQAEQRLIAANARVGMARALYFPQISLTGTGGAASNQLTSVLTNSAAYWLAAGSLTQPIFDAGRIRSNYRLSQAQREELVVEYRKTIVEALRDVTDALAAYQSSHVRRTHQNAQVEAAADAVRLARLRYSGGSTSYLEVLTTDTQLYSAQLQLAKVQEQEASSLVQLYSALGGGWR